jgi:hypothetical protein
VALAGCIGPQNPDRENPDEGGPIGPLDEEFLAAHNAVRASVGAGLPDLAWSGELADFAQAWADELKARTGDCDVRTLATPHRPSSGDFAQRYGENISWNAGTVRGPADVVAGWASERAFYTYATNSCNTSAQCGHYTQIVWRDTARVGCGLVRCDGPTVPLGVSQIWVCNYDPPGNVLTQRPY